MNNLIINTDARILVTGSNGFIGSKVVETLLNYGFINLRCFVRPSSELSTLKKIIGNFNKAKIEVVSGNLLSNTDCQNAAKDVSIIFHLAAGRGKSFPVCYANSVISARNLLEASLTNSAFKRFVNVSSMAVYSTEKLKHNSVLDESCEIEPQPAKSCDAYSFGKLKQDELLLEYSRNYQIPYAILRPGAVFGPGKKAISGRIGIDTFGIFLHMGGSNQIPLTYIDNCAEAIVLAGINKSAESQIFNIVDDNLPTSRKFMKMYKKNVQRFNSIYIPKWTSYFFCYLWEKYSKWSNGQLPPVFNRGRWKTEWKGNQYSNQKLKSVLAWQPKVTMEEGFTRFFEYCRNNGVAS